MDESQPAAGPAVLEAPSTRQAPPPEAAAFRYPDRAAKHWLLASVVWLTVVDLFGLVLATQFITPEAFGNISWLAFNRVRPSHVNGVILAWLTMMYFGALFYMLPRLCGTRGMWSERLGVWTAWAWNLMFLLGVIALLTGHSQGRERREHPCDRRDPDDQTDLRLRLVLHREPDLAGGRLRDRQRDLEPGQGV